MPALIVMSSYSPVKALKPMLKLFSPRHRRTSSAMTRARPGPEFSAKRADRLLQGPHDDFGASFLVAVQLLGGFLNGADGANQGHAAAGQDAFGDRRAGRMQRVLDASLLLLHARLPSRRRRADDRDAALRHLGEAFAESCSLSYSLLGPTLVHLGGDLIDAGHDGVLLAGAVDERAAFFLDADHLGLAQLVELDIFELQAKVFADELAAGEDRDVAQQRLAAIAEAGRALTAHCCMQTAAQAV